MNLFTIEYPKNAASGIGWKESAESQDNLRLVKMITETAQLLSTSIATVQHNINIPKNPNLYKITHANHPSCLYTRSSYSSFMNVLEHGLSLYEEYDFRFGKLHKAGEVIKYIRDNYVDFASLYLPHIEVDFIKYMAMPDQYKVSNDPVECYRLFYANKPLLRYGKTFMPAWVQKLRDPNLPPVIII